MNTPSMHTDRLTQLKQSARFVIAGGFNVLSTMVMFWLLLDVAGLQYVVSSLLTWVVGITVNFTFMWFWVFKEDSISDAFQTYQRHFVFHAIYYGVNLALLVLFTELTGGHPLLVQAALLIFLLPFNFLGTKYLVMNVATLSRFLTR